MSAELEQVAPGGIVQLQNAPAALDDDTFDSLFPSEQPVSVQPQVASPVVTETPANPQSPVTPAVQPQTGDTDFFLKGEKTVYKTKEAALEGLNQKDSLVDQLRQRYALVTGIDPISGQPVGAQPQASQPQVLDYSSNPEKYIDDLYRAAKEGGPQAYAQVQQKFLMDSLKPLQPVMQKLVRDQAIQSASQDVKDIGTFLGTSNYSKALDSNAQLKDAISVAEQDSRFYSQLPGLYKTAYFVAQGMQLPDLLKANATQQTTPQAPPVVPRPTLQSQTQPVPTQTARPTLRNLEGIRATIAEMESRGAKLDF